MIGCLTNCVQLALIPMQMMAASIRLFDMLLITATFEPWFLEVRLRTSSHAETAGGQGAQGLFSVPTPARILIIFF
jgi:hypothetical protein